MYQLMMWISYTLRKWTVVSHRNINILVYNLAWYCEISKYHLHAYKLFGKRKKGWLVHYRGCRCAEGRYVWDNGEKKWWRRVELPCLGALAREVTKWRRCWVMERVVKVEMIFLLQWRVRVERSVKGGRQRWCRFNASVLTQEGRR
jgi:hypothetical protein